jgi:hypothetical protein
LGIRIGLVGDAATGLWSVNEKGRRGVRLVGEGSREVELGLGSLGYRMETGPASEGVREGVSKLRRRGEGLECEGAREWGSLG